MPLLIDGLWFRPREDFLETRIAPQRIPFPAQAQVGERDAPWRIRPIDRAGGSKKTLDQWNRLVRLAYKRIDQRQVGRSGSAKKWAPAFWLEFDGSMPFTKSIFHSVHVGVEQSEPSMAGRVIGIVAYLFLEI